MLAFSWLYLNDSVELRPSPLVVLINAVVITAVFAGAWFWRERPAGRGLTVLLAVLAGALAGFDLGMYFPVGNDPHFREIIGRLISAGRGLLIGLPVGGAVGMIVSRRAGAFRFGAGMVFLSLFLIATIPLANVYWSSKFSALIRFSMFLAVTPS